MIALYHQLIGLNVIRGVCFLATSQSDRYDLDALIRDFASEIKFANHVNMVVCWQATKQFSEKFFLNSLLVGDEGSSRQVFGATHQAYPSGSHQPAFEVCILDDLLRYLQNPAEEEARQKIKYKD